MKAKYLIVKHSCYGDYEDETIPVRICESYTLEETDGYEVYEILDNGEIGNIVKGCGEFSEQGFALVDWKGFDDEGVPTFDKVKLIEKVECKSRKDFIQTEQFKKWKKYVEDSEYIEDYENDILGTGSFCEDYDENKEHFYVITEYSGNRLSYPY